MVGGEGGWPQGPSCSWKSQSGLLEESAQEVLEESAQEVLEVCGQAAGPGVLGPPP